jgi:hypothetical protein
MLLSYPSLYSYLLGCKLSRNILQGDPLGREVPGCGLALTIGAHATNIRAKEFIDTVHLRGKFKPLSTCLALTLAVLFVPVNGDGKLEPGRAEE